MITAGLTMKNVLVINAHHPYPFSNGKLNQTLSEKAESLLTNKGYQVRTIRSAEPYDINEQLENHQWADIVVLQSPVNWMGVPWSFKKYMDEVYTAGMAGQLCDGDGRNSDAPQKNYGTGGTLKSKKYMLSLTFNAPEEAFEAKDEYLFQGKAVDDLFFPMHMNFRFFGMEPLETFASYDVMKNPQIETDFKRFEKHIETHF